MFLNTNSGDRHLATGIRRQGTEFRAQIIVSRESCVVCRESFSFFNSFDPYTPDRRGGIP